MSLTLRLAGELRRIFVGCTNLSVASQSGDEEVRKMNPRLMDASVLYIDKLERITCGNRD